MYKENKVKLKASDQSQSMHKKSVQNCTSKGGITPSNLTRSNDNHLI